MNLYLDFCDLLQKPFAISSFSSIISPPLFTICLHYIHIRVIYNFYTLYIRKEIFFFSLSILHIVFFIIAPVISLKIPGPPLCPVFFFVYFRLNSILSSKITFFFHLFTFYVKSKKASHMHAKPFL